MKVISNQELANIIGDLNLYIEVKSRSNVQEYEQMRFEYPVRFSYLESYLYLNLEENLFTLYELTTRSKIESEMKKFLHSLPGEGRKDEQYEGPFNFIRIC